MLLQRAQSCLQHTQSFPIPEPGGKIQSIVLEICVSLEG